MKNIKINIVYIWIAIGLLCLVNYSYKEGLYKRHGQLVEYVINNYINEKAYKNDLKHNWIINTINKLNLKKENYDKLDILYEQFMLKNKDDIKDVKDITDELYKMNKKITKDDLMYVTNTLNEIKENESKREDLFKEIINKINKGEYHRNNKYLSIEEVLGLI